MKRIQLFILVLMASTMLVAQAPLPTSWDFSSATYPQGYSENDIDFYTSTTVTCSMAPSAKLYSTGSYIEIFVADQMGDISYTLRGTGQGDGTFHLLESPDGNSWTLLDETIGFSTNACAGESNTPDAASRYLRFLLETKVSGSNLSLDNISIGLAAPSTAPEINILEETNPLYSGITVNASSEVNVSETITLTVQNLGTADDLVLDLASSPFVGVGFSYNAAMGTTLTIAPNSSENLLVDFLPTSQGTFQSTVVLANNDSNEGSYEINFFGVGGGLATEPTEQATALAFTDVKSYRFTSDLSYNSGSADGYIVLRNTTAAIDEPEDGVVYGVGDQIGDSKVVSVGLATSYYATGILAATTYDHRVFAYNGFDTLTNYLTTTPLVESVTTAGAYSGAYYDAIDETMPTFPDDLTALIFTNTIVFYGNYDEAMIDGFYGVDTTNALKTVTDQYTNETVEYQDPWSWTGLSYTREHVLPHSWMPSYDSESVPEYHDIHSLLPVAGDANDARGNFVFDEVVTALNTFGDATQGLRADGKPCFEPADNVKGDVARTIFYMVARHNGIDNLDWGLNHLNIGQSNTKQSQNVLLQWHLDDPVSNLEIARNDYVDSLKSNRNPFIDHPEWVCYIDFDEYAYRAPTSAPCLATATPEIAELQNAVTLFPNPAADFLTIEFEHEFRGDISLEVLNVTGKLMQKQLLGKNATNLTETLDLTGLNAGFYLLNIRMDGQSFAKKFVVE